MTNMTRSSTLSLRRPAAAALTTSRPAKSVTTAPAERHAANGNDAAPAAAETSERVLRSDAQGLQPNFAQLLDVAQLVVALGDLEPRVAPCAFHPGGCHRS